MLGSFCGDGWFFEVIILINGLFEVGGAEGCCRSIDAGCCCCGNGRADKDRRSGQVILCFLCFCLVACLFDQVLLDVHLAWRSVIEICRNWKNSFSDCLIMFLFGELTLD